MLAHAVTRWELDYPSLIPLLLLISLYGIGAMRLQQRRPIPHWQMATFGAGMLCLGIALVSPLETLSHSLFTAHMIQHLILLVIVPPLCIRANALLTLLWAFPFQQRKAIMQGLRRVHLPLWIWLLHAGVMWLWHIPAFYSAALNSPLIHGLEHFTFFTTALLYWWVLVYPPRLNYAISIFSAFAMMMQCSLLGMLLTFANRPWYLHHQGGLGLTALEDQQVAGLLMWLPTGLIYLLAAAVLLYQWLEKAPAVGRNNAGLR